MPRFKDPATIIVVLAVLQVLSSTYFLDIPNFYVVDSFIFLLTGVGICICLLQASSFHSKVHGIINKQLLFKVLIITLLLPVSYAAGPAHYGQYTITVHRC